MVNKTMSRAPTVVGGTDEDIMKIQRSIPMILLDVPPPLPKFMAFYKQVSYVLYSIHIVKSFKKN
jgi:hypothetical protein